MLKYFWQINNVDCEYIDIKKNGFNLNWLPQKWRSFCKLGNKIDKSKFKSFVIISLATQLKDREIFILQFKQYSDYRNELISWSLYKTKAKEYAKIVGLPYNPEDFVTHIKTKLQENYKLTDAVLSDEDNASIKNGKLTLRKVKANKKHALYKALDSLLDGMSGI